MIRRECKSLRSKEALPLCTICCNADDVLPPDLRRALALDGYPGPAPPLAVDPAAASDSASASTLDSAMKGLGARGWQCALSSRIGYPNQALHSSGCHFLCIYRTRSSLRMRPNGIALLRVQALFLALFLGGAKHRPGAPVYTPTLSLYFAITGLCFSFISRGPKRKEPMLLDSGQTKRWRICSASSLGW